MKSFLLVLIFVSIFSLSQAGHKVDPNGYPWPDLYDQWQGFYFTPGANTVSQIWVKPGYASSQVQENGKYTLAQVEADPSNGTFRFYTQGPTAPGSTFSFNSLIRSEINLGPLPGNEFLDFSQAIYNGTYIWTGPLNATHNMTQAVERWIFVRIFSAFGRKIIESGIDAMTRKFMWYFRSTDPTVNPEVINTFWNIQNIPQDQGFFEPLVGGPSTTFCYADLAAFFSGQSSCPPTH
jgi:hypothetical protein